jgi:threonine dehydratase
MTSDAAPDVEFSPATEADMPFIRTTAERLVLDANNFSAEQFITVRRNGKIIAFGRVRPYNETFELATLGVVEEHQNNGLGEAVARELIRRFPQDEVYVVTDLVDYWERLGFLRTDVLPRELEQKREVACATLRPGATGLIYDRIIERFPTIADVYAARTRIAPHLQRSPLARNVKLSAELDCDVYLKLELLQPIGAFKVRGGVNLASQLTDDERRRGIIGASTGNHGQSLAYGAHLLGIPCIIAMPDHANLMKVAAMEALGAQVEFRGPDFEEARLWAEGHAPETGMRYVHHIRTPELIAGVATISLEVVEDLPEVDTIIVATGGGSGAIGHCIVAKALRPNIEVIAVQAEGAPAIYNSWRDRRIQEAPIHTAAEGLATGVAYYPAVKTFIDKLDDMVLVSEDEINQAVRALGRTAHIVTEPSGAASMAAAYKLRDRLRGKKVALIVSGGNLPLDDLRDILSVSS